MYGKYQDVTLNNARKIHQHSCLQWQELRGLMASITMLYKADAR